MIGPGFGEQIAKSLMTALIGAVIAAFALGVLAIYGLPKLWAWLMPIIHAATS